MSGFKFIVEVCDEVFVLEKESLVPVSVDSERSKCFHTYLNRDTRYSFSDHFDYSIDPLEHYDIRG